MGWRLALVTLWIVRGGTVSDQVKPRVTGPALEPVAAIPEPIEFRTIADVEADITVTRQLVAIERAAWVRAWPSRETDNLCNDRLDYVIELNWLLEEWQALNAHG